MTVIAYRDGFMAADRLACNQYLKTGEVTKIHVVGDALVGMSGDMARCMVWMDWFRRGARPEDFPGILGDPNNFVASLVVGRDGVPYRYEFTPFPFKREEKYTAIGSGFEAAMAAMYLGKSALEAVEVACAICDGCGAGTDVLHLRDIDAAQVAA